MLDFSAAVGAATGFDVVDAAIGAATMVGSCKYVSFSVLLQTPGAEFLSAVIGWAGAWPITVPVVSGKFPTGSRVA